jgi:hypothetical protein
MCNLQPTSSYNQLAPPHVYPATAMVLIMCTALQRPSSCQLSKGKCTYFVWSIINNEAIIRWCGTH